MHMGAMIIFEVTNHIDYLVALLDNLCNRPLANCDDYLYILTSREQRNIAYRCAGAAAAAGGDDDGDDDDGWSSQHHWRAP